MLLLSLKHFFFVFIFFKLLGSLQILKLFLLILTEYFFFFNFRKNTSVHLSFNERRRLTIENEMLLQCIIIFFKLFYFTIQHTKVKIHF